MSFEALKIEESLCIVVGVLTRCWSSKILVIVLHQGACELKENIPNLIDIQMHSLLSHHQIMSIVTVPHKLLVILLFEWCHNFS